MNDSISVYVDLFGSLQYFQVSYFIRGTDLNVKWVAYERTHSFSVDYTDGLSFLSGPTSQGPKKEARAGVPVILTVRLKQPQALR